MNDLGKILVLGAGRLASGIERFFSKVVVVDKTVCDITDRSIVQNTVDREKPAIVINTAAVTSPALCEQDPGLCWKVNVFGARNVAAVCSSRSVRSVHISSNWAADPCNEYGMSKVASEHVGMDLIIRSCFYDEGYWALSSLARGDPTPLIETDMFNPISIDGLLKVLERLLVRQSFGIVNVGVVDRVSHYDFGIELARIFGFSTDRIEPISSVSSSYEYPFNTYLEPHPLSRISISDDIRDFRGSIEWRVNESEPENQSRDTRQR